MAVVAVVVGVLFMMRKKEQSRQRILTRGGRGGRGWQRRQGRNEQVHNNAAFDDSNAIGSDNVGDSHVYRNDAYQNVPQSSLNRDQANNVDGGGDDVGKLLHLLREIGGIWKFKFYKIKRKCCFSTKARFCSTFRSVSIGGFIKGQPLYNRNRQV